MMPIVQTMAILARNPTIRSMRPRMIMRTPVQQLGLDAWADCCQEAPSRISPSEGAGTRIDVTLGRRSLGGVMTAVPVCASSARTQIPLGMCVRDHLCADGAELAALCPCLCP